MKTIVALVDFSDVTAKIVKHAGDLAKAFEARVILLHIVPRESIEVDPNLDSPVLLESVAEQDDSTDFAGLEALRDAVTQRGVKVAIERLTEGTVEKLLEECRTWTADLIVVGSHHHSTIYNWCVGTFTADVLHGASCPVLVIPGEAEAA
jgi:nucleotide-binding universal stress UspA family protein